MQKSNSCDYYDDPEFDYRDYWVGREYEDLAERQILRHIFSRIGKQGKFVDIGGGYGRLVETYIPWVGEAVLVEPAGKTLEEARKIAKKLPNLRLKHGSAESLPLKNEEFDAAQMIRVAHHCINLKLVFDEAARVLVDGGWFILEFPNKIHGLMTINNWLKGNMDYRKELNSIDRRAVFNQSDEVIPFMNHHPDKILESLEEAGFTVVKCWSVSNLRRVNFLSVGLRLVIDKWLWGLARPVWWGPSIFVLAQK